LEIREFVRTNYKKVIGWGTGGYFDKYFGEVSVDIDYLIDSDETKWGKQKNGLNIVSPDHLLDEDPIQTLIIVFSSFFYEIKERVKSYGDFDVVSAYQMKRIVLDKKPILESDELDRPVIITISGGNFTEFIGGTSKFIREQMDLILRQGKTHLHLFWMYYDFKVYRDHLIFVVKNGRLIGAYPFEKVNSVLPLVEKLVIHNLMFLNTDVLDRMIDSLPANAKLIYYLHDYSCICKNIKLMYNNEIFCGAFNKQWEPCLTCKYNEKRIRIYEYHVGLFHNRKDLQLIAPSEHVKKNICIAFNLDADRIRVIPHQTFELATVKRKVTHDKIRIAYVGYKNQHKGWEVFKQIVNRFGRKYDFYCFGRTDEYLENVRHVEVSFIEDGPLAMVKKLEQYQIDVAFLWSLCPETYSYTYFESGTAGAFVLTSILSGNIAEQTLRYQNGTVLKGDDELFELLNNEEQLRHMLEQQRVVFRNLRINFEEINSVIA